VLTPQGLPRGKRPLYPFPAMPKATTPATAAPPRRGIRRASQPGRAVSLPLRCFDRAYNPGAKPLPQAKSHWGFAPSLSATTISGEGKEWGSSSGEKEVGLSGASSTARREPLEGAAPGRRRGEVEASWDLDAANPFLTVVCSLHQASADSTIDPRLVESSFLPHSR
jgi:hypothetical protein